MRYTNPQYSKPRGFGIPMDSFLCFGRNWVLLLLSAVIVLLTQSDVSGQTYTQTNGTVTTCTGTFTDSGGGGTGAAAQYGNNENSTFTICSSSATSCLRVTFTAFNTESGFDILTVYDGSNTSGMLLASLTGNGVPAANVIISSTGCLTFKFVSDGSTTKAGWTATISCGACPLANDLACTASPISCNQTLAGTTNGATLTGPGEGITCGAAQTSPGVWYTITGNGQIMTASLCGTAWDSKIEVFSGSCMALNCVGGNNDGGPDCAASTSASYSWTSVTGVNYFILVSGLSTTSNFNLALNCTAAPVCSDCTTATNIPSLPFTGNYTTCGACDNMIYGDGCTSFYQDGEDYFFKYTPTTTGTVNIALTNTLTYTGIFVTQGCPTSGGTCVTSSTSSSGNPSLAATLTAGVTYYIIIDTWPLPDCTPFTISVQPPPPAPANDLVCAATPISCGQTLSGTTAGATNTGTSENETCGGIAQTQPGVWYSIIGSGQNILANLCGTSWDSGIQVYTGATCSSLTCVTGNNDSGPGCLGTSASVQWTAATGQTYYIKVFGIASTSAFSLSITCQAPCASGCAGGPAPINDACSGATNLGQLPVPAACPNGVGTLQVTNTTNLCATAEPNQSSLLGCQPSGNQASPAADVWYRFTLVAPILNVTINGLATPNIALYEGTSCANSIPRGCAIGASGLLNTAFQGLAAGTYFLQVSGGNVLDQCNFTMTLQNNYDCAGCVTASNLDVTPPPVNGMYQANQQVTFCVSITDYQQTSVNWLHGVVPTFGAGWDMSTLTTVPATSCSGDGTWSWYNSNITSSATGSVTGPGFYFETDLGSSSGVFDANPGNNFGDDNFSNSCDWTFCWTIKTKPILNCVQDQSLNIVINTLGDGESGSWSSLACTLDPLISFFAQSNCCLQPTTTSVRPSCFGSSDGTITATGLGTAPWTYVWRDQIGNILQTNALVAGPATISGLQSGDYILQVTDATGCTSTVAINLPNTPQLAASVTTPTPSVCSGSSGTVNFTATPNTVLSYSVNGGATQTVAIGANGTASITTPALTAAATITLISISNAVAPLCTEPLNTSITIGVVTLPTATISGTTIFCSGSSSNIIFNGTPNSTIAYTVNGVGGQSITLNAAGTATISTGPLTSTTTYALSTVSITSPITCSQNAVGSATVTVSPVATASLTATSSVCSGSTGTVTFTGTPNAIVTYTVNGGANQTITLNGGGSATLTTSALTSNATYTLVSVSNGSAPACPQTLTASTIIAVVPPPVANLVVPATICSGSTATITLNASTNTVVTFTVAGIPATATIGSSGTTTFTTPVLTGPMTVPVVLTGVSYSILAPCPVVLNTTYNINVTAGVTPTFNPIPLTYCYNAAAPSLPTTSTNGVVGTWSPSIINTHAVGTSVYTFTPTSGGCPGSPYTLSITVYENPTVYAHGTNPTCTTICNGSAVVDVVGGLGPYTYAWSNGATTQTASNLCVGPYSVTVTDAHGCQSQAFTPVTSCFAIQSILVNSCSTIEEQEEMVFFQVGQSPLNYTTLNVTWPTYTASGGASDPWSGFCTNPAYIAAANATITNGGLLLAPPANNLLPANANVVIITSNILNAPIADFTHLSDTIYVLFQCNNTLNNLGHFSNSAASSNPLVMNFGGGCSESVTYVPTSLPNYAGSSNGGYVLYSAGGTPTYANYGCSIPYTIQANQVVLTAPTPVTTTFNSVGPYCQGTTVPALPTSSTNSPAITGTWAPTISSAVGTTTYTFTPTTGLCATTANLSITVNPIATANAGSAQTICSGTSATLAGTIGGGATTATWSAPSGTFSNANSLTSSYTPSITTGSVVLTLTTNDPDGAGPCVAVSSTVTITVNTAPNAGSNGSLNLCASGSTINLFSSLVGTPANTGTWSGPSTLTGGNLGTFNPLSNTAGTYTYTVTGLSPCPPATATVNVSIGAAPTATLNYPSPLCSNAAGTVSPTIVGTLGGTFSASPSGLSISSTTGIITPASSSANTYTVTYTIPAANGCSAFTTTSSVVITSAPAMPTLSPDPPCANTATTFTAGNGSWFEFFINGVSQGIPSATNTLNTAGLTAGTQVCVRSYPVPPFVFDGLINEPQWGTPIATSVGGPATSGFGNNRMDALYIKNMNGMLYGAVASAEEDGSTQPFNNRILLFIDSKPGGYNSLSAWTNRLGTPTNTDGIKNLNSGITFDAGFQADYILAMNCANGGGQGYFDLYDMSADVNTFLGSSPNPARFGYQPNSAVGDFSKGFEFTIPLASIGSPVTSFKLFGMMVNDPNPANASFVSNQFFTHANPAQGNFADGSIDFNNEPPNPVTALLGADCYQEKCVTVIAPVTPTFNPIPPLCYGATAPVLPTTSTNGITGTWSPAVSNTASGTYTFTPTSPQCATTQTMNIVVQPLTSTTPIYHD